MASLTVSSSSGLSFTGVPYEQADGKAIARAFRPEFFPERFIKRIGWARDLPVLSYLGCLIACIFSCRHPAEVLRSTGNTQSRALHAARPWCGRTVPAFSAALIFVMLNRDISTGPDGKRGPAAVFIAPAISCAIVRADRCGYGRWRTCWRFQTVHPIRGNLAVWSKPGLLWGVSATFVIVLPQGSQAHVPRRGRFFLSWNLHFRYRCCTACFFMLKRAGSSFSYVCVLLCRFSAIVQGVVPDCRCHYRLPFGLEIIRLLFGAPTCVQLRVPW